MSAQDYTPTGIFPYLRASGGFGPLQLQNRGDVLSEAGTFQANADIASVSNTTPMVVTTAAPHYFATGDKVRVTDSDDAGANGSWAITVINGTSFSLNTSVADGGGSAVGFVTALQRGTLGKLIDACDIMGQALGMAANHVYGDPIAIPVGVTFNNTVHMSGGNVTVSATIVMSGSTTVSNALGVKLTGTQPAATADPGANNIAVATNQSKAWGNVSIGGGTTTINDGYNVASATISGLGVNIAFARPMANANYSVTFGIQIGDVEVIGSGYVPQVFSDDQGTFKTANGFRISLWDGSAIINPAAASGLKVSFDVKGRQ